ncbi:TPA: MptD family putative ECF transporter S component [Streptococcus agalactiae]
MNNKENKLQVKDLIMIGVFSALYFLFNMVGGIPFAMNPVLTFYQPMGSAFLSGIIFMFLIAKAPKKGTISILAIIMCILRLATGIVAELIAGSKSYKNKKMNMLSFGVFALGDIGTFLVYFMNPKSWSDAMIKKGTDITYIESMNAAAADWMIYVIVIGTFLVALLSAWIGMKLLKKQFEKAGIV